MYVSKRLRSRPAAVTRNLHGMYQVQNVFLAILPIPLSLFVQTTGTDPRARSAQEGSEQLA